jgi:hypothetical protein
MQNIDNEKWLSRIANLYFFLEENNFIDKVQNVNVYELHSRDDNYKCLHYILRNLYDLLLINLHHITDLEENMESIFTYFYEPTQTIFSFGIRNNAWQFTKVEVRLTPPYKKS